MFEDVPTILLRMESHDRKRFLVELEMDSSDATLSSCLAVSNDLKFFPNPEV